MSLGEQPQQLGRRLGGVRILGDDDAAHAAADHVQLCLAGADAAAGQRDLLLRYEAVDVEIGAKAAAVDQDSRLQAEGGDRSQVDEQDVRVVEVASRQVAQLQRA